MAQVETQMSGGTVDRPIGVGVGVPGDLLAAVVRKEPAGSEETGLAISAATGSRRRPSIGEMGLGFASLFAWLGFFGAGTVVSTKLCRDELAGAAHLGFWRATSDLLITMCCYTVTNLFFLAAFSAILGCMASRWQSRTADEAAPAVRAPRTDYMAATLRGFLLYALAISGLLVVSNESTITDTTAGQFVRLAGFLSSFGFVVGYDAQFFSRFVSKIETLGAPLRGSEK